MKLRALILAFCLPLALSVTFYACCKDYAAFFEIRDISLNFNKPWATEKTVKDSAANFAPSSIYLTYNVSMIASVNPFISSAMATSCEQSGGRGLKKGTITTINVTTLYDYDDKHPKGSNVNEMLKITGNNYGDRYTIDELLAKFAKNEAIVDVSGYVLEINHNKKVITPTISFNKIPFQLEIELALSDGTKHKAKSEFIYILGN